MGQEITWRLAGKNERYVQSAESDDAPRCSFYNKSKTEVEKLITNPPDRPFRAYICNECVEVCLLAMEDSSTVDISGAQI